MASYSLLSSVPIYPNQAEWLMGGFGAVAEDDTLVIRRERGQVVMADGTEDIPSMPPVIIVPASRALGGPPVWRPNLELGRHKHVRFGAPTWSSTPRASGRRGIR